MASFTRKHPRTGEKMYLSLQRALSYTLLILLSFICLFSFYILIINSTRAHPDIQKGFSLLPGNSFLVNVKNVLNNQDLPVLSGLLNSFIISTCVACVATYFSTLTAFGIHAYNFKFKKLAYPLILLIMMVPTQVSVLGFIKLMMDFQLMDTFVPLIVPSIASPVVFFFMKQYMDATLPVEIVEASRIDGAGEFYTFNHMVVPIMKPAIAVQAIFAFVGAWNNYFVPALILETPGKKTIPILIAQLRSADFLKFDMGQVYVLITIAILPAVIIYMFLSKFIIRGITIGAVKG